MIDADDRPDDEKMPLLEHLLELRRRLLYSAATFMIAFGGCYFAAKPIYAFLVRPLAEIMGEIGGSQRMIYTALTEAFFTYLKVALFGAGIIGFPMFAAQLWMFIAPGLYKHEKKAFLPFLIISPVLFGLGAALVYSFVIPMAWRFLLGFQTTAAETVLPIELEARVGEYLTLIMKLIFAFGLSFQLPVALTLMARVGLVSSAGLAAKRKYAVVVVFIAAAVLTPPDVISQIGLALPLLLLYEASILSARMVEKGRAKHRWEEPGGETAPPRESGPASDPSGARQSASRPQKPPPQDGQGVGETDFNA